jgi:hypothetical protein
MLLDRGVIPPRLTKTRFYRNDEGDRVVEFTLKGDAHLPLHGAAPYVQLLREILELESGEDLAETVRKIKEKLSTPVPPPDRPQGKAAAFDGFSFERLSPDAKQLPNVEDIEPISHIEDSRIWGPCLVTYRPVGVFPAPDDRDDVLYSVAWIRDYEPIARWEKAVLEPEWEVFR